MSSLNMPQRKRIQHAATCKGFTAETTMNCMYTVSPFMYTIILAQMHTHTNTQVVS